MGIFNYILFAVVINVNNFSQAYIHRCKKCKYLCSSTMPSED